jgi:hypothetical protein
MAAVMVRRWSGFLLLVLGAGSCAGSDESGINAACQSRCDELCAEFERCEVAERSPSCVDDCSAALRSADCSDATPPSQLTCDELAEVARCASHCSALCARAPECGGFDQQLCLEGCTADEPVLCNAASVPARTCDQIKPEARWYEELGRALHDEDSDVGGFHSPASFSLCDSAADCDVPLACSLATNTCGSCVDDQECARGFGEPYACSAGECLAVECAVDDDCFGGVCDSEHVCRDCRSDVDCSFTNPVCDTEALECVECLEDAHCQAASVVIYPACDVPNRECVECTRDEHCTDLDQPRCGAEARCVECVSDSDCPGSTCDVEHGFCEFAG